MGSLTNVKPTSRLEVSQKLGLGQMSLNCAFDSKTLTKSHKRLVPQLGYKKLGLWDLRPTTQEITCYS